MFRFSALALSLALVTPASAQTQNDCGPSRQMYAHLANNYGESRDAAGLSGQVILELWTNPETGSFTILVTRPDGMSCHAASGEAWGKAPQGEAS